MTRTMLTRFAVLLASALACCCPPPWPAGKAAVEAPKADPAQDLLERLETAASDLRDFQADIIYWKWDAALGRPEIRQGQVLYQSAPGGVLRRFAILLDLQIVNNRKREKHRHYIFDGSWLVEIDYDEKLFIKRQVVPPGQTFDPLKLGEGPFPLPVGQPKKEVEARFEVSALAKPQDETLATGLGDTPAEGLLLVPRPDTPEAKDIRRVELFYDPKTLLPVGICLTETGGDRKTVVLRNLKRNQGVDEAKLNILEPDPKEWHIEVVPYRE